VGAYGLSHTLPQIQQNANLLSPSTPIKSAVVAKIHDFPYTAISKLSINTSPAVQLTINTILFICSEAIVYLTGTNNLHQQKQ
jgi:hypothetical protein